MCQNCYVKVDWKFKIKNYLGVKEPTDPSKTFLMVFCFFKELIQSLMMNLNGKMIFKVKTFTRTVNLTHAVFRFVSYSRKDFLLGISYQAMMAVY